MTTFVSSNHKLTHTAYLLTYLLTYCRFTFLLALILPPIINLLYNHKNVYVDYNYLLDVKLHFTLSQHILICMAHLQNTTIRAYYCRAHQPSLAVRRRGISSYWQS